MCVTLTARLWKGLASCGCGNALSPAGEPSWDVSGEDHGHQTLRRRVLNIQQCSHLNVAPAKRNLNKVDFLNLGLKSNLFMEVSREIYCFLS